MGDDPAKAPTPPKLPSKTPRSIRKFVACETDSAELRADNIGWLPEFGGLPDPTVTLESGTTPSSATVVLSWMSGFVNLTIAAAVVDGALQVEPPDVPSQLGGDQVTDAINRWTADLNAVLKFHEKQLSGLTVNDGVLRLTKSDIIAHDETEASSSTGTTVPPTDPPPSDSSPPSGSSPPATKTLPGGCSLMSMMLMIAFLGVVAVGVFLLVGGGSDEDTAVGGGDEVEVATSAPTAEVPTPDPTNAPPEATATTVPTPTAVPLGPGQLTDPLGDQENACSGGASISDADLSSVGDLVSVDVRQPTNGQVLVVVGVNGNVSDFVANDGFSLAAEIQIDGPGQSALVGAQQHNGSALDYVDDNTTGQPLPGATVNSLMEGQTLVLAVNGLGDLTDADAQITIYNLPTSDGVFSCDQSEPFKVPAPAQELPAPQPTPSDTTSGAPTTVTPIMAETQQGMYRAAEGAGLQLPGKASLVDSFDSYDGLPHMTWYVRVGPDGSILHTRENAEPGGPAASSIMGIEAYPDGHGNWWATVRLIDTTKSTVYAVNSPRESNSDPDAPLPTPQSAEEAVSLALTGLVSDGKIVQPNDPRLD